MSDTGLRVFPPWSVTPMSTGNALTGIKKQSGYSSDSSHVGFRAPKGLNSTQEIAASFTTVRSVPLKKYLV